MVLCKETEQMRKHFCWKFKNDILKQRKKMASLGFQNIDTNRSYLPEKPSKYAPYVVLIAVVLITKTCLYTFDSFKPHLYIVKLGYILFFLFLLKSIDCGYSLEPPRRGGSNEYPQSMF